MTVLIWIRENLSFGSGRFEQRHRRREYKQNVVSGSNFKSKFFGVGYVIILVLVGVGLIAAHHFFNSFLNEKSISSASTELSSQWKDQGNTKFMGATIAHGVRIALSMAIGVTLVQLFWVTLRSRSNTISQIDALVKCGTSPFKTSAFRAATASFLVLLVSLISSSMSLVVILAPGSLTVVTDFQRTKPCEVFTVPPAVDSVCMLLPQQLPWTALKVLASNTYVPPLLLDRDAACEGASTCPYDVSFHGPAFDCTDTTNQTDLSELISRLQLRTLPPVGASLIYGLGYANPNSSNLTVNIFSQDLARDVTRVTTCTAYNASYEARVTSFEGNANLPTVQVQNVSIHRDSVLVGFTQVAQTFVSTFATSVVDNLQTLVYAGPDGFITGGEFDSQFGAIQTSHLFGTTSTGNVTFNDDIIHFHESYMQNVSLSLLSGNVYYCFSDDTETNLQKVNTTCDTTLSVYVYDPMRLLLTYGVALGVACSVAAVGCWLILRDGKKRKMLFSQVTRIALNEELFRDSSNLEPKKPLRLERRTDEVAAFKLVPLPADTETEKAAQLVPSRKPSLWNRFRKLLAMAQGKSVLLVILTATCMVLHDMYYRYLNGRTPSPRLRLSGSSWLVDQTIVSSVGTALAYVAQTLLGVALAITCTRRFWRTLRLRARTVQQIDALMSVQNSPFAPSAFRAIRASPSIVFLTILATSLSLISIFAPGSITISSNHRQSRACTVATPKNLSAQSIPSNLNSSIIYMTPSLIALASGTYLPPINPCDLEDAVGCQYNLNFVGPGFECNNVTAMGNQTAFTTPQIAGNVSETLLFEASILPQDQSLTMNLSVQTWDAENSIYTETSCGGVVRQYSIAVSHTNSGSSIDVMESSVVSAIHTNISQLSNFSEVYLYSIMWALQGIEMRNYALTGQMQLSTVVMGNLFTVPLDGNVIWNNNMPLALESFVQNATLGVLLGQISTFNSNNPNLLQNTTMACTYLLPAYEYTSYRLYLTYGLAIAAVVLSVVWGAYTVRQIGMEESMSFSRFLRAVLNEHMFNARSDLTKDTKFEVDGKEGNLVPVLPGK